jgi:hypothetical protein
MRWRLAAGIVIGLLVVAGVLIGTGIVDGLHFPRRTNQPGAIIPSNFKPAFVINWPGPPHEDSTAIVSEHGQMSIYTALYTDRRPDGVLVLSVIAMEYPAAFQEELSAEERLEAALLGLKKSELSGKKLMHGPKNYPGLEVRKRTVGTSSRRMAILAGRIMYDVSATSKEEKLLDLPEVDAFFKSFAIVD